MSIHPNQSKRYVSKSDHFVFNVRNARRELLRGDDGYSREVETAPAIVVEFKNLMQHSLTPEYDRAVATRHFFPQAAWRANDAKHESHSIMGALPSMTPQGMFQPGPGGTQNLIGMTSAYDPTVHFGIFELAWLADVESRAYAERVLDTNGLNGLEYMEVVAESLPSPWPSYDKIGQGASLKIPAMVRDLGLDAVGVYAYEAATKNREGVLKALLELAEAKLEADVDQAGLERIL
ncbi:MAG: hypothetical protein H0X39_00030 [Actinobacteria bacterium]|nr:hypothetical protein [Actinomycetota bacterium]